MRTGISNRRVALTSVLSLSLAGFGCGEAKADKPGATPNADGTAVSMPKSDRITMAEFKKLNAANNVVIVDVRSNDAYIGGHIPGALSIPEETIDAATAEKLKKMGKPIATYCS